MYKYKYIYINIYKQIRCIKELTYIAQLYCLKTARLPLLNYMHIRGIQALQIESPHHVVPTTYIFFYKFKD